MCKTKKNNGSKHKVSLYVLNYNQFIIDWELGFKFIQGRVNTWEFKADKWIKIVE